MLVFSVPSEAAASPLDSYPGVAGCESSPFPWHCGLICFLKTAKTMMMDLVNPEKEAMFSARFNGEGTTNITTNSSGREKVTLALCPVIQGKHSYSKDGVQAS